MNNDYLIFLFPSCKNKWNIINNEIHNSNLSVIKSKKINLTDIGKFNLINNLYIGEDWLGNENNNFDGLYYKLNSCFVNNINECYIYYVNTSAKEIKLIKQKIRNICNIGNHSIHTTDTIEEAKRLANIYFNNNTIRFLNCIKKVNQPNFNILFEKLTNYLNKNNIKNDEICLSGSSVLSIYNLRDCYDIDLLSKNKSINKIDEKIEVYNNYYLESKFHKTTNISIDEIFDNEMNYFYYNDIKIMSLEILKKFKMYRSEKKDIIDIALIDEVLNNENYKC